MARSTRLVILIRHMYNVWCRKRFFHPITYFPTNLFYSFTLRVKGIKKCAISVYNFTRLPTLSYLKSYRKFSFRIVV